MSATPGSGVKWTPEQLKAITARGCDVLVSASAGTGKTTVLVERVIRSILDPATRIGVDRLLVVTFTEAAAAQMRERINQALLDRALADPADQWLADQLALLPRAHISTLHSWCLGIVRENFFRLGLDPALRVLDEHEAELLRLETLDELFEERYEREDHAFLDLVDRYGDDRGDEPLRHLVLDLHAFVRGLPDPRAWLARAAGAFDVPDGMGLLGSGWGNALRAMVMGRLQMAIASLRDAISICSRPGGPLVYAGCLGEDLARLGRFAEVLGAQGGDWGDFCASAAELLSDWPKLTAGRGVPEEVRLAVRNARDRARKTAQGMIDLFLGRPEAALLAELRRCHAPMKALAELVTALDDAARRARVLHGQLDFGDFEHYTLTLLRDGGGGGESKGGPEGTRQADAAGARPSVLARELQERYAEILVDEYQDVNDTQNEILHLVSRGNLFCIGDDKQSIYRFRGTNPSFFREMSSKVKTTGSLIGLARNYRSRPAVLHAANFVFRQIMTTETAEIDYTGDTFLRPGSSDYDKSPDADGPVELYVLERFGSASSGARPGPEGTQPAGPGDDNGADEDDEAEAASELQADEIEREANHLAERIRAMVGGPGGGEAAFTVYDKRSKTYRPVSYGDIAVLMRAVKGRANRYLEVFARRGIPVRAELSTGYFAAIEVETMLSLLEVIDNPRQDIPLAAVLRSPLVGLDEPALAAIRLAAMREDLYDAVLAAAAGAQQPPVGAANAAAAHPEPQYAAGLRVFLSRLEQWRTAARRGPLGDLVWRLLQETDYLGFCGGLPSGAQRQANLVALYERAREFDRFAKQGLQRFLRFVRRLHETQSDLGATSDKGGQDAVLLTSIHKSKGLEFPVVFLPDLGRQMRHPGGRRDVLWHRELGLGPALADRDLGIKYPTLAWHLVDWLLAREDLAEEMRVLYVAMTRARERLVLGGSVRGLQSRLLAWAATATCMTDGGGTGAAMDALPAVSVTTAPTYLDWICRAVARHSDAAVIVDSAGAAPASAAPPAGAQGWSVFEDDPSRWHVTLTPATRAGLGRSENDWDSASGLSPDELRRIAGLEPLGVSLPPELVGALDARLAWRYPASGRSRVHAKLYASELRAEHISLGASAGAGTGAEAEGDPVAQLPAAAPQAADTWAGPDFSPWGASVPASSSPARRGVLTHLVLQHIDLRRPVDMQGLREQVSAMHRASKLSREDAAKIDLQSLAWFFETVEGRTLLSHPDAVRREVPFALALQATDVISGTGTGCGLPPGDVDVNESSCTAPGAVAQDGLSGEMILVQGILDCLVQTPEGWMLLDFKTDRVTPGEVPARAVIYASQIGMYVRAVHEILGGTVSQIRLVFLHPRIVWPLSVDGRGGGRA